MTALERCTAEQQRIESGPLLTKEDCYYGAMGWADWEVEKRLIQPVCIDLFCGLGGWTEGFLAEGWDVVGFDNHRHEYLKSGVTEDGAKWVENQRYPAQLVIQDVLTLHGSQFRNAACIVASPPCQRYSWMAMPWSLAKREASWQRWHRDSSFSPGFDLNDLFNACFRIQREACEAAGRHIPLVVENVKGAQPWVGQAKAHFGSYYLWGDVESVGGRIVAGRVRFGEFAKVRSVSKNNGNGSWFNEAHGQKIPGNQAGAPQRGDGLKNDIVGGGSWFAIGSPGQQTTGGNQDGRKVPGFNFHAHENGIAGGSFQSAAVKVASESGRRTDVGKGARFTSRDCGDEAVKVPGINWSGHGKPGYKPQGFNVTAAQRYREGNGDSGTKQGGNWWHDPESMTRKFSSRSDSRKAASAEIAKIPFPLSSFLARQFYPEAQ